MKRTVVAFAARQYSQIPLGDMADRVGRAIGCSFREPRRDDTPGVLAVLLGVTVDLYDTRGLDGAVVYVLSSRVIDPRWLPDDDAEELEFETIDITSAVIDVLAIGGAGEWHAPSDAELAAERAHATRRHKRIEREEAAEAERRRRVGES